MKWPGTNTHQTQVKTGKKAEHQPMQLVKMSSFQMEQWLRRHQTQFNYITTDNKEWERKSVLV